MEVHYLVGGRAGIDRTAYPDLDAFWSDLAAAYRAEIADLGKAGCAYLQLDDVTFAFLCDVNRQAEVERWGDDPERLVHTYIELFNQAVRGRRAGMTVALHICRGNASAHWGAEGGYDPVAEALFNGLDVDAFFLEYDSPRAGTFAPLRFLPANKMAVLGLVTTKSAELESKDALKRRIDEAARHAPLDRLCLSPQCGFASNYVGNPVTIEDQQRKLALIVETAREVWG
jgi:5-methyltetrahydropteroyltriglutamate--homocysteine methyltransferase